MEMTAALRCDEMRREAGRGVGPALGDRPEAGRGVRTYVEEVDRAAPRLFCFHLVLRLVLHIHRHSPTPHPVRPSPSPRLYRALSPLRLGGNRGGSRRGERVPGLVLDWEPCWGTETMVEAGSLDGGRGGTRDGARGGRPAGGRDLHVSDLTKVTGEPKVSNGSGLPNERITKLLVFSFLKNCSNCNFLSELETLGRGLHVPAALCEEYDDELQTDGNRSSRHAMERNERDSQSHEEVIQHIAFRLAQIGDEMERGVHQSLVQSLARRFMDMNLSEEGRMEHLRMAVDHLMQNCPKDMELEKAKLMLTMLLAKKVADHMPSLLHDVFRTTVNFINQNLLGYVRNLARNSQDMLLCRGGEGLRYDYWKRATVQSTAYTDEDCRTTWDVAGQASEWALMLVFYKQRWLQCSEHFVPMGQD
ncbi:PREDICTED: uncharacterized protein LOC102853343 [Elephantulus edwardii]|uniref:uncharacterized protein LOC102853343 n=1 Tax=Elephantulus edwardii TaxID=28737 RepID=UPI0003F09610|nr:PREDICTED: uncharacterized protein LOC102853343 [Elephantulus edwardii]